MVAALGSVGFNNVNLGEMFKAEKHPAEFFQRDAEVLERVREMKTPEMTDGIVEHLVKEGKPGSAEYVQVFSKSVVLDKELALAEAGKLNNQQLESEGLPIMIDTAQTTPDMLQEGRAVLTPEARQEFLGSLNSLSYKLQQHIAKTADTAAAYYAAEFSHKATFSEKFQAMLGKKPEPFEIPFTPNEAEFAQLQEVSTRSFTSPEEQQKTFEGLLRQMMRNRPAVMGLGTSADLAEHFGKLTEELGGKMDGSVDVTKLRDVNRFMTNQGMAELGIYPEFGQAIQERATIDFSQNATRVEAQVETPEKSGLDWLSEDISQETKDRLQKNGIGQLTEIYSEQEKGIAQLLAKGLQETAATKDNINLEKINELLGSPEHKDDQETLKLMLRIAIKVGAKIAVSIAKNIAKDKDTPEELRVLFGSFADMVDAGGKFADKLIAGDPKANLDNDLIKFFEKSE